MKIARIPDLNDPFEYLSLSLTNAQVRDAILGLKTQLTENYAVLCFSGNWQNPFIWSHYADGDCGICLGFDVEHPLRRVSYKSERLEFSVDRFLPKLTLTHKEMLETVETKYVDWQYEDESRAAVSLDHSTREHGLYFKELDANLVLLEVILGVRCENPPAAISCPVATALQPMTVISAALADGSFEVAAGIKRTQSRGGSGMRSIQCCQTPRQLLPRRAVIVMHSEALSPDAASRLAFHQEPSAGRP